MSLKKKKSWVF